MTPIIKEAAVFQSGRLRRTGFGDMPDHPPDDCLAADRAELAAVHAEWMRTGDKESLPALQHLGDAFDQRAVRRQLEGNHLSGVGRNKKEGDFGNEHKIPFLIVRKQAVAVDLQEATHTGLEIGVNQLQLGLVRGLGALGGEALGLPEDLSKLVNQLNKFNRRGAIGGLADF